MQKKKKKKANKKIFVFQDCVWLMQNNNHVNNAAEFKKWMFT